MDFPSFDQTQPMQGTQPEVTQEKTVETALPSFDQTKEPPSSFDNTMDTVKAGVEGLERGMSLGTSDWMRTHIDPLVTGESPEIIQKEMAQRQEQHNIASKTGETIGSIAPMMATEGAAGALGVKAAISELHAMAKIGANAIKGGLEMGIIGGGDALSEQMLGKGDPEAPVASALSHIGASALFGTITGGAFSGAGVGLAKLGEAKTAHKMAQFAEDFGSRWKFLTENPEMVDTVKKELHDFHSSTSAAADEVYGSGGLKDQAIKKLVPEMNPNIQKQNQELADTFEQKIHEMVKDPDTYPARLVKTIQKETNEWMNVATNPDASPYEIFNASQKLKQKFQYFSKFDKQVNPFAPERGFVDASKELGYKLRTALEDNKAWGQAADLQKGVNKAFTEFHPSLKDFQSKFTEKLEGDPIVSSGKVNTYINQLGKPNAELKQTMLKGYVDAAEKYRGKISDMYHNLGLESPIEPASLNAVKETLQEKTAGGQLADYLKNKIPGKIGTIVGEGAGAALFGLPGLFIGKELAPYLEKAVGRPLTNAGGSAALKVIESNAPGSTAEALQHAVNVERGSKKITSAMANLFKSGGSKAVDSIVTDKEREKIHKFVEGGGTNQQIQNQLQHEKKNQGATQGFAEGGVVKPITPNVSEDSGSKLGAVYPAQDMLMQAAKGRVYNYLNSLRPQKNSAKLPFDKEPNSKIAQKTYNKAIDMAAQPLNILNKVKDGSLSIDDMKHFKQLYPEVYSHLSKEMTKNISEQQLNDERPSYKTRQGMSLFLGASLDSSFTPQNIMAAQSVFAKQKAEKQAAMGSGAKTSKLKDTANPYRTTDQAAQARQSQ